jgi:hypothetical protein
MFSAKITDSWQNSKLTRNQNKLLSVNMTDKKWMLLTNDSFLWWFNRAKLEKIEKIEEIDKISIKTIFN